MTRQSHRSRRKVARPSGTGGHAREVLADTLQGVSKVLKGLIAFVVLLALVAGLPWALWHYIGWPLPDHIPSWDEAEATLLNPMSPQFLLDTLGCLCWIVWFFFAIDVARCVLDAARGVTWPEFRPAGPLRGLAAALIGTIVLTVLGNRTPAAPPATAAVLTSDLAPTAVTAPLHPGPAPPATSAQRQTTMTIDWSAPAPPGMAKATEEIRLPHNEGGTMVYDSLWRVAQRMFGDGNRWPELFAQNRGIVQADGRALTQPHLVRPGWEITGYIPALAPPAAQPPDEQQLPAPSQPPPATIPTTPPTTTQSAPTTNPAPARDTNITDRTGEHGAADPPGLELSTGAFVSLVLAGVITAAAVSVRIWRRRRYRVGSGDRSDLHQPIAPVVRALRAAHDDNDGHNGLDDVDVEPPLVPTTRVDLAAVGAIEPGDDPVPVAARVGVRGGRELALDLASTRGLGLLGPGATAAARALLLHLLAQHVQDGEHVRILVPAPDLALIVGGTDTARLPSTVRVVDSLDAALDEMEAELLTRTRHHVDETNTQPPTATLVLLGTPAAHAERRLQAVLDNGSTLGIAGILFGQWRPGTTVRVRPDGTISATSPGPGDSLTGARLFTLPATDTTALLTVLRQAEQPTDLEPGDAKPDEETPVNEDVQGERSGEQQTPPQQGRVEGLTQLESTHLPAPCEADLRVPVSFPKLLDVQCAPAKTEPRTALSIHATVDDRHEPGSQPEQPPPGEGAEEPVLRRPLTLRVLGRVHLVLREDTGERELGGALTPKQREVLVYLALHPHGVRREALNDAIWPEARPPRPFNSLHNALSLLRRALTTATHGVITDLIRNDDGRYQLDRDLVTTDYERLHTALQAPRTGTGNDALAPLNQAIAHYSGDLADDLTAAWIEPFRESLRRDILDGIAALIRAHSDTDPQTGLMLLERSRKLDPYNEGIYRDIIRTQAGLGQYNAISRTLALLASTLDDIGQKPSRDTINLAEFLQHRSSTGRTSSGSIAAS